MKNITLLPLFAILIFSHNLIGQSYYNEMLNSRKQQNIKKPEIAIEDSYFNRQVKYLNSIPLVKDKSIRQNTIEYNLSEALTYRWFDAGSISTWLEKSLSKFTYDGRYLLIEEIQKYFNGYAWENSELISHFYNSIDSISSSLYQLWSDSVWTNNTLWTYSYNSSNQRVQMLKQVWGSQWENSYFYENTFNDSLLITMLEKYWNGMTWVRYILYTYNYDLDRKLINLLLQTYNSSTLQNVSRFSYSYNLQSNMIEELYQHWIDSTWINAWRFLYSYNSNNDIITKLLQVWTDSTWINNKLFTLNYDENDNLSEIIEQHPDGLNWGNDYKTNYVYTPITALENTNLIIEHYYLSQNYPNPFNPSTKITYSIPERSNVSLKVFDLLGSEVIELVNGEIETGTYDINFNASQLSSGIYFYKLQAGSFVQTRKMILLK